MTVLTIRQSRQDEAAETMARTASSPWAAGAWTSFRTPDRRILLLSIVLQIALAALFGHAYDTRIFMGAGYLVGSGQNPYLAQDLSAVFHHVYFHSLTTIGYPPPWPLILGVVYRGTYAVVPNAAVYNLAMKVPVVAANVGLAYLVGAVLQNLGAPAVVARRAWVFLLLNPFLLYFGAAWGQIDPIVALLSLAALALLFAGRRASSAVLLALAVSFKPTALPLLPVALVYLAARPARRAAHYATVFVAAALLFCAAPFLIFGWTSAPISHRWNAHFLSNGAMSYMTFVRLFHDPLVLKGSWWLLGLAWIPALAIGIFVLKRGDVAFEDLIRNGTAVVLIFFLTRTFLAEPNVVLVLPLVLILTSLDGLDRRALTAVWVLPLAFTVFNCSPLQLLFVNFPETMAKGLEAVAPYHTLTLSARAVLVVAWQVAGWWIVVSCLKKGSAGTRDNASGGASENAAEELAP